MQLANFVISRQFLTAVNLSGPGDSQCWQRISWQQDTSPRQRRHPATPWHPSASSQPHLVPCHIYRQQKAFLTCWLKPRSRGGKPQAFHKDPFQELTLSILLKEHLQAINTPLLSLSHTEPDKKTPVLQKPQDRNQAGHLMALCADTQGRVLFSGSILDVMLMRDDLSEQESSSEILNIHVSGFQNLESIFHIYKG